MAVYTLFGQPSSPATLNVDNGGYTFGLQFSVSVAATLTGIWWYSPSGASSNRPSVIALYDAGTQTLIHSETPTWSGAGGSGWIRAPFSSPPSLSTGHAYKGCLYDNPGANWYAGTGSYFTTGPGASGVTNGPLSAPNNAGADAGQESYNTSNAYPSSSFGTNYWVDVEVTVAGSSPSGLLMAGIV